MRFETVPSFYVIGKLGQGTAENSKDWIPPLWQAASGNFREAAPQIKFTPSGAPAGVWAIMSDMAETFQPWQPEEGGKYLAGFEAQDDAPPPPGWSKWQVPSFRYLIAATTIADYQSTMEQVLQHEFPARNYTLAGAIHEHYPDPDNPASIELYFPIERMMKIQ
ncbi:MAG: GyrI-like domain-containing protein [Planctomycetes bacterium]|nr:GyrI-like domain-containing protein [Planctomycetota bacterium]